MLIGDMDTHKNAQTVKEFSQYRIQGTPWAYGMKSRALSIVSTLRIHTIRGK